MNTDDPTPDIAAPDTPEPVPGVRKSAAVHIHPVADPDAWRNATLPDPMLPKAGPGPGPGVTDGAEVSAGDEAAQ